MHSSEKKSVLRCVACGSRKFEIHGPLTDHAVIHCAKCGAQVGYYRELVSEVEERAADKEHEKRKPRLH